MKKTITVLAAISTLAGCSTRKPPVSTTSISENAQRVASCLSASDYTAAQHIFDDYLKHDTRTFSGEYAIKWLYYLLSFNVDLIDDLDAWCSSKNATHAAYLARGKWYMDEAWRVRGGGWGSSVKNESWPLFYQNLEKAESDLQTAYELNPNDPCAAKYMITVCMGKGSSFEEMEKWFIRAVQKHPDFLGAYRNMAWAMYPRWGGDEQVLLSFIHTAIQNHPELPVFTTLKTSWYFKEKERELRKNDSPEFRELCALLLDYSTRSPNDSQPLRALANAYWEQGQKEEAITCMDKAIGIDPSFENYYRRGYFYYSMRKLQRARHDLENALAQHPFDLDALKNLARVEYRTKPPNYDRAIELFSKALKIDPDMESTLALRGKSYQRIKKYPEAKADLEKSLSLNPRTDWAWYSLGEIEWKHYKNAEKAVYCITRSINISADYSCHFLRGQIYRETGQHAEAIQDFEKAIQFRKKSREKIEPLIILCRQELDKQIAADRQAGLSAKTAGESDMEQGTKDQL